MLSAVLSILFFLPLGIVAIVYAAQVDSKWQAGDFAGARAASKTARTLANISVGVAAILFCAIIAFGAMAANSTKKSSNMNAYLNCMSNSYTTASDCEHYLH